MPDHAHPQYYVGSSRVDITPDAIGVPMLGWGDAFHRVKGVATPLYARSIAIFDGAKKKKTIFLCLDICFVSEALRERIQKESGLLDEELVLSATHTHSAPGGFSYYPLYASSCGGIVDSVLETYALGSLQAIRESMERAEPARLKLASGEFHPSIPVAFNRSIHAYNKNPEVKRKLPRSKRHLAVDREMVLLRADSLDGKPLAVMNWFSVHATSVHRNRYKIHSDNKGLAAVDMEQKLYNRHAFEGVAIFAQGAAGDVSPNFARYFPLLEKRGVSRNDIRSARANARFHVDLAMLLFEEAGSNPEISGPISGILEFTDFTNIEVDPVFVRGKQGLKTGPAEIGISALYGTAEGRGAPLPLIWFAIVGIRIAQLYNFFVDSLFGKKPKWPFDPDPIQGNKIRAIQSGESMIFETTRIGKLVFPGFLNPILATIKRWGRLGVLKNTPFTPPILPLQLSRLGSLMFVVVPAEFTTISGKRLVKLIEEKFQDQGITRVILQGFANAYSGYVVTPEEYPRQGYEAGCTHFGRWTLPAYLTRFSELCDRWKKGEPRKNLRPTPLNPEYLAQAKFIPTSK